MSANHPSFHILVTGGAGYIGSITTAALIEAGYQVTVLDNLATGYREAIHPEARFFKGDISDPTIIQSICQTGIDAVMHFAAFIEVGESVLNPSKYYHNNLVKSIRFFDALIAGGVRHLVFSSTAAVYGDPEQIPLTEDNPLTPANPYGWSKMMVETVLKNYDMAYGFKYVSLRYFNAGGAKGPFGENHNPESHLIPRILNAVIDNTPLEVFGTDYNTRDGSCIRDYIHVEDLAQAHILAMHYLLNGGKSETFNLGTGTGYTVLEVIRTVEQIVGHSVSFIASERREGDAPVLVAAPQKARNILKWGVKLKSLDEIVRSAWEWKRVHPHGYTS